MIVVDPSPNFLVEPFIGHVVSGLSTELAGHGYACLLYGQRECSESENLFHTYSRTDGICVFLSGPTAARRRFMEALMRLKEPIVAIEEIEDFSSDDVALVRQDDEQGARNIVEHLLSCGARSFIFLTPEPVWPAMIMRERGIRSALRQFPKKTHFEKVTCGFGNFEDVQKSLSKWLDGNPLVDAIISNNDHIGIAAIKTLNTRGIRIPRDIMVTGFNGFEFWNYSDPLLTTTVSPAYQLGREGARLLLERLSSGRFPTHDLVLPLSFRQGQSTKARVGDVE